MDISSLETFITIAETGSFSRTAERLYLTQPAVSKRLASLEAELGAVLLDRLPKKTLLTEAGTVYLPQARRIVEEIAEGKRLLDQLSSEIQGELCITTSHHLGLHRLPQILRRYHKQYPKVDLDLDFVGSEEGYHKILQGQADLAVTTLPQVTTDPVLSKTIWEDPMQIVIAKDHPQLHGQVTVQELQQHPALLPDESTTTRQLIDQSLGDIGMSQYKLGPSTNFMETIRMLVSAGLGWSVLPRIMIDEKLRSVEHTGFQCGRDLGIVYHRNRTLSRAGLAFVQLLEKECA